MGCSKQVCYFTFRDGVAVRVPGLGAVEWGETEKRTLVKRIRRVFDIKPEKTLALSANKYHDPGKYARIVGTTLDSIKEWQKANKDPELTKINLTDRENFPHIIRLLYQRALSADNNILLDAWALDNLKVKK